MTKFNGKLTILESQKYFASTSLRKNLNINYVGQCEKSYFR